MPKAYVILTEDIKDQEGMKAYGQAAAATLMEAGARILAADQEPRTLEGEWHGDQTVVIEFESMEAARAWYESPAYQEAKSLREVAADSNAVIVSGFEMPPS